MGLYDHCFYFIFGNDDLVAVLLEDLRTQFRSFGEGLQIVNDKIEKWIKKLTYKLKKIL